MTHLRRIHEAIDDTLSSATSSDKYIKYIFFSAIVNAAVNAACHSRRDSTCGQHQSKPSSFAKQHAPTTPVMPVEQGRTHIEVTVGQIRTSSSHASRWYPGTSSTQPGWK
eukprot:TRINITY_DN2203_c0_g1_i2.p1 TRINITY_DN2203_c0_g1~~TRINITY_DN2203_c0_g1_i2.p1  ORF type:complete len:110 (+),score=2.93 TRINITY_DN2203_c0_g1_i2:673-1002(+)